MRKKRKRAKWPLKIKILYSVVAVMLVMVTGLGAITVYGNHLLGSFDRSDESIDIASDVFDTDESMDKSIEIANVEDILLPNDSFKGRTEDGIYNILLLGEDSRDNEDSTIRGRTDAMIVATINTTEHSVSLTSFMRDMYVKIPGYTDNKMNSAYAKGGVDLLYDVFSTNFDLELDGYVLVNFNMFEDIIDELGGVTITLSQKEASYLNSTNYINDVYQRNVVTGSQLMTGSQALGYARVRYVGNDDYERTERQRNVLEAIFEKFKSKNLLEMASILESVVPHIKTDLSSNDMLTIARKALSADLSNINSYRIPIDGTIENKYVNQMSVLVVDFEENTKAVHQYIFGDDYESDSTKESSEE